MSNIDPTGGLPRAGRVNLDESIQLTALVALNDHGSVARYALRCCGGGLAARPPHGLFLSRSR